MERCPASQSMCRFFRLFGQERSFLPLTEPEEQHNDQAFSNRDGHDERGARHALRFLPDIRRRRRDGSRSASARPSVKSRRLDGSAVDAVPTSTQRLWTSGENTLFESASAIHVIAQASSRKSSETSSRSKPLDHLQRNDRTHRSGW